MRSRLRTPVAAAAVAALLAGTAGFCSFNLPAPAPPDAGPALRPPASLLPEAIVPFPIDEIDEQL